MGAPSIAPPSQGATSYSYPSGIADVPYYLQLNFLRYERPTTKEDGKLIPAGTVSLPIPLQIAEEFGMEWTERELGIFGNTWKDVTSTAQSMAGDVIGGAKYTWDNIGGILTGDTQAITNGMRGFTTGLGKALTLLTPNFLQESIFGDVVSDTNKIVRNPHMTKVFQNVELRVHRFSWLLSPRSEEESKDLEHLINFVRSAMHPSYTPGMGRFALDFPYYVYGNFKGTDYIYPIKRGVVTKFQMDFSSGGQMSFYKGGAPVQIKMDMEIAEIETLTRADFAGHPDKNGNYAGASVTQVADTHQ